MAYFHAYRIVPRLQKEQSALRPQMEMGFD